MCVYTLDLIHEKRQLIQSNLSENELINSSERTVYAEICYANVTWGLLFFISVADIAGARSQEFHSPRHMCCGDVTIKLIWFDFQWAAWLWLFALFFTQLFNILYRFFILLFLLISLFCSHYNSFVFILFKWFKIIFSVFFQLLLICFVVLSSFC